MKILLFLCVFRIFVKAFQNKGSEGILETLGSGETELETKIFKKSLKFVFYECFWFFEKKYETKGRKYG